jgi:hypothetical protein
MGLLFWRRSKDPTGEFNRYLPDHIAAFLAAVPARGLKLVEATPSGEAVFVRDSTSNRRVALLPLIAEVEPAEDAGLDDVAAARMPRPVTAAFEWVKGEWKPTGRTLFNLAPADVVARSGGRYVPLDPPHV